jgi:hypothetical protein
MLILGAGPAGLELAGEIKDVWPDKYVELTWSAGGYPFGGRGSLPGAIVR